MCALIIHKAYWTKPLGQVQKDELSSDSCCKDPASIASDRLPFLALFFFFLFFLLLSSAAAASIASIQNSPYNQVQRLHVGVT